MTCTHSLNLKKRKCFLVNIASFSLDAKVIVESGDRERFEQRIQPIGQKEKTIHPHGTTLINTYDDKGRRKKFFAEVKN